jgi:hypothetical protein
MCPFGRYRASDRGGGQRYGILASMASPASSQAPRSELAAVVAAAGDLGVECATYAGLLRRHRVSLYERGMVIRRGGSVLTFRWENVRIYRIMAGRSGFFVLSKVRYRYRFVAPAGASGKVGPRFPHLREWLPAVQSAVLSARLPAAVAVASAGGVVAFGPVALTAREVRVRSKAAPWSAVKRVKITPGYLHILVHQGRSFSVSLSRIPNDFLLLELARQLAPAVRVG